MRIWEYGNIRTPICKIDKTRIAKRASLPRFLMLCTTLSDYIFRIEIEQAFDVVRHYDKRAAF